jgi:hypothetical protein
MFVQRIKSLSRPDIGRRGEVRDIHRPFTDPQLQWTATADGIAMAF